MYLYHSVIYPQVMPYECTQCRHVIPALNAWSIRTWYMAPSLIVSPFTRHGCMDDLTTERSFISDHIESLKCLTYFLPCYPRVFVQPDTGSRPVDWCRFWIEIEMSIEMPSTAMTQVACESKLCSVVRSSMHPCPRHWLANGRAVVYSAWAAQAFSAGIKCRHCMCVQVDSLLLARVWDSQGHIPYTSHLTVIYERN